MSALYVDTPTSVLEGWHIQGGGVDCDEAITNTIFHAFQIAAANPVDDEAVPQSAQAQLEIIEVVGYSWFCRSDIVGKEKD